MTSRSCVSFHCLTLYYNFLLYHLFYQLPNDLLEAESVFSVSISQIATKGPENWWKFSRIAFEKREQWTRCCWFSKSKNLHQTRSSKLFKKKNLKRSVSAVWVFEEGWCGPGNLAELLPWLFNLFPLQAAFFHLSSLSLGHIFLSEAFNF